MNSFPQKPLGIKNYGHIVHLSTSRMDANDHKSNDGQERIATVQKRDKFDEVFVQEKLDGSNVGVARLGERLLPLVRSGYLAESSPYEQHWQFANWVYQHADRFYAVLEDGERLCGEWLMQAHGTRYALQHEAFVAFDLMRGQERTPFDEFLQRIEAGNFITPKLLHRGEAISVQAVLKLLGQYGFHGALDTVEGAVWRVERAGVVDFLVKYVRLDKQDGLYLPEISGQTPVWNWRPEAEIKTPRA
jgi:RNA ligase